MEFLQNIRLDRNSFWIGFLAASLFWWLVRISRPLLARFRQSFRSQAEIVQWESRSVVEVRLRNETLRYAQSQHLAAALFSLDEITLPPRLLVSGLTPETIDNLPTLDITETLIPDTPDWPQIASHYNWPSLSLAEALSAGANLAITGQPGTGKSVALAHFASQLARKEIEISGMQSALPLYAHAADLVLPATSPDSLSSPLETALANYISQETFSKLSALIIQVLKEGRAVLILDGMDELDPSGFDLAVAYLEQLLGVFPKLRVITAVSSENWGSLPQMGFQMLPLATWNQRQRGLFLENWGNLWKQHFSNTHVDTSLPDPDLIKGWLVSESASLTPLELVCKTWAAFAGDSTGSKALDAMDAYLRRKLVGLNEKQRKALEHVATQMLLTQQPIAEKTTLERWLGGQDEFKELLEDPTLLEPGAESQPRSSKLKVRSGSTLASFIECGILRPHAGDRYAISHAVWTGYLAAKMLDVGIAFRALDAQKPWDARNLAMQFLASQTETNEWIGKRLQHNSEALLPRFLLQASRWLPYAPNDAQWSKLILRGLASELHNPAWTMQVKARLLAALIGSGNSGVSVLLRQLLRAPELETRQLAILGLGMIRDAKAVEDLSKFLKPEEEPRIASASILSLVSIGSKQALEAVATILLQGNEHLRRSAAEAFANDMEEGHPTLKDASEMEDPGIRRAAVYGLARLNQAWADQIVETLRTDDPQWVVQDAANQVMSLRSVDNTRIPTNLPALSQTPWLIEFAASRGLGVAPGEPAVQLLYTALKEGDQKQKIAALYTISRQSHSAHMSQLEESYHSPDAEIRQAAVEAIYRLQTCGIDFVHPSQ